MLRTLASIGSILTAVAMLLFGHGLQSALLPLRAELEGFGTFAIGATISGYFLGFVVGCLVGPYLILRAGHIRAYAAMVSLASATALFHPLLIDPTAWIGFRFLTGFCIASFYIVIESWLNERVSNEVRGFVMSAYVVVALGATMAGQLATAFGDISGFNLFILASIVASLAVIPIALTTTTQPAAITVVKFRPKQLYQTSPAAFVGCILIGVSAGSTWMLAPIFATSKGFDVQFASIFAAVMIGGGAIIQWPVGRLSDRFDRRLILAVLGLGSVFTCLALGVTQSNQASFYLILVFLVGIFTHSTYAIAVAHAFDSSEPDTYVETSSSLLLCYGIGSTIGPIVASFLMEKSDAGALFLFVAAVQAVLVGYVAWRMVANTAPTKFDREDFDLASTAPVVAMGVDEAVEANDDILIPEEVAMEISLEDSQAEIQLSDIGLDNDPEQTLDRSVDFEDLKPD